MGFIPEQFFLNSPISHSDETTHTHGCQDSPGSLWNNSRSLDVKSDYLLARKTAQEWNPLGSSPRPQPALKNNGVYLTGLAGYFARLNAKLPSIPAPRRDQELARATLHEKRTFSIARGALASLPSSRARQDIGGQL